MLVRGNIITKDRSHYTKPECVVVTSFEIGSFGILAIHFQDLLVDYFS